MSTMPGAGFIKTSQGCRPLRWMRFWPSFFSLPPGQVVEFLDELMPRQSRPLWGLLIPPGPRIITHMETHNPPIRHAIQLGAPAKAGSAVSKKRTVDWEAIERDYRTGLDSVRELAVKHRLSHTAINKRAEKENWTKDLRAKILARADAEVSRRMVSTQVSTETRISEWKLVEATAEAIVQVRLSHRADIAAARSILMSLLSELRAICGSENAALLAELGEMMRAPDEYGNDRFNDIYQKVSSLPGRAKTMKDLGDALKTLIALEREAFNLDEAPEDAVEDRPMSDAEMAVRLFAVFGDKL